MELTANYWLLIVIVLLVAVLAAWRIFAATRRTRVQLDAKPDEAQPAQRNQALIDAAPAATQPVVPPTPEGLAGVGEAVAAAAAPEPIVAAASAEADDLTRIKGLGPKLAEQLKTLGVTRYAQIAAWDEAEIDRIDSQLGRFAGRIRRDDWVGQAKLLGESDTVGYEARFGKL